MLVRRVTSHLTAPVVSVSSLRSHLQSWLFLPPSFTMSHMAHLVEPGLYLPYDHLQVMSVIRRVLHEVGPTFITGVNELLPAANGVQVGAVNMTAEQSFQLLVWSNHLFDVEGAVPFIFDRLEQETRVTIQGIYTREFIPLVEYPTRLAMCFLTGLTAYCELQVSPLGFSLRARCNAANVLEVDRVITADNYILEPGNANIASVDGGVYNFDHIPAFAWPVVHPA